MNTEYPVEHIEPIPAGEPLPARKVLRSWLLPLMQQDTARAMRLLVVDYIIFFALIFAAIAAPNGWLRLVASLLSGYWIGRLFIIGHDACHQSYTPHRKLNRVLGRIAFLPSLSPYSLWEVGHNVIHHGFTNLKGMDFIWIPMSKAEYDSMSGTRKVMERFYRSGFGPWMYYMVEIWWKKMYFPNKEHKPGNREAFFWDGVLVSVFAVIWLIAIALIAPAFEVSLLSAVVTGFVIPFIFWNGMIGWAVYVHHNHARIQFYDNKKEWAAANPFVTTTVHLTFNKPWGAMMHHIMEHTAHHLDMTIPLYKLKEAQDRLEELLPGRIVVQKFSLGWYFKNAKHCRLYDYEHKQWIDYDGNPSKAY